MARRGPSWEGSGRARWPDPGASDHAEFTHRPRVRHHRLRRAATLPATAGEIRTATPLEATSLATDNLHVVAYFVPAAGDFYEVTATWVDAEGSAPQRLVLSLDDGERVSFALPGHEETLFTFAREIDALAVSSEPAHREESATEPLRPAAQVPRGLARRVGSAAAGSSGQGCLRVAAAQVAAHVGIGGAPRSPAGRRWSAPAAAPARAAR